MATKGKAAKVYTVTDKGKKAMTQVEVLIAKLEPLVSQVTLAKLTERLETYRRGQQLYIESSTPSRYQKRLAVAQAETVDFVLSLIEEQRRQAVWDYTKVGWGVE
jgi:DNA-binding PadR family transcriptional regulator